MRAAAVAYTAFIVASLFWLGALKVFAPIALARHRSGYLPNWRGHHFFGSARIKITSRRQRP
jgi:hypothetical protein